MKVLLNEIKHVTVKCNLFIQTHFHMTKNILIFSVEKYNMLDPSRISCFEPEVFIPTGACSQ